MYICKYVYMYICIYVYIAPDRKIEHRFWKLQKWYPSRRSTRSGQFGKIFFFVTKSQFAAYMQRNGFFRVFTGTFWIFLRMIAQGGLEHGTLYSGRSCCCFVFQETSKTTHVARQFPCTNQAWCRKTRFWQRKGSENV